MNRPTDPPSPTHVPGTSKGEEQVVRHGHEPGRGVEGAASYQNARDSTSINPERRGPIDPRMPHMPPP